MVNSNEKIKCPTGNDKPSLENYWTIYDKKHNIYCNEVGEEFGEIFCSPAEGCIYDHESKDGKPKCRLNSKPHLGNVYINGGFGFGKLCLDNNFTRFILLITYPPLYIYIMEKEKQKKKMDVHNKYVPMNIKAIILCFIYTCMFYFPGLIYGMYYMFHPDNHAMTCMGDFIAEASLGAGTLGMVHGVEAIDKEVKEAED